MRFNQGRPYPCLAFTGQGFFFAGRGLEIFPEGSPNEKKEPRSTPRLPVLTGTPGGIRTPDPRLRRPLLYPTELLARGFFRRHCIPGTGRKGKGYAGRRPLAARAKQVKDRDVRRTIRHRPGSGRPGRPVPEGWGEKQKGQGAVALPRTRRRWDAALSCVVAGPRPPTRPVRWRRGTGWRVQGPASPLCRCQQGKLRLFLQWLSQQNN